MNFLPRAATLVAFVLAANLEPLDQKPSYSHAENPVTSVFFLNSGDVWSSGFTDGGGPAVIKTEDSGKSWKATRLPSPFVEINFLTPNIGWAARYGTKAGEPGSVILSSTANGGATWQELNPTPPQLLADITITDLLVVSSEEGWLIGTNGDGKSAVLHLLSRGNRLERDDSLSGQDFVPEAIFAGRKGQLWIVGGDKIWHRTNKSGSWEQEYPVQPIPSGHLPTKWAGGAAFEDGRVLVFGGSRRNIIMLSENDGDTWKSVYESSDGHGLKTGTFWDPLHGCVVGYSNQLHCTTNGGRNWAVAGRLPVRPHAAGSPEPLFNKVYFSDQWRGWVLEEFGILYKTENGGGSWDEIDWKRLAASLSGL